MRFLPLTRQVELDYANPEKVITAFPGTQFYRSGNNNFYIIRDGIYRRIDLKKRSFTLAYQKEPWFSTIADQDIIFSEPFELWIKDGAGNNAIGWRFVSYKTLRLEEIPGQTPLPNPTVTPTNTPSPTIVPPTPSVTSTATPTPTATPTATVTPTVTPSISSTPSPTPTATPTPTGTLTPTPTPTSTTGPSIPMNKLLVWLDGADSSTIVTSSVNQITTWNNKATSSFNATAITSPIFTQSIQNSLPGVDFSSEKSMQIGSLPLGAFTEFLVFKTNWAGILLEHSTNANGGGHYLYGTTFYTMLHSTPTGDSHKDYTFNWSATNQWMIVCHTVDGTSAGHKMYKNAVDLNLGGGNSVGTASMTKDYFIGSRAGTGLYSNMKMGELLIYSGSLDETSIQGAFSYLNNKWNVY